MGIWEVERDEGSCVYACVVMAKVGVNICRMEFYFSLSSHLLVIELIEHVSWKFWRNLKISSIFFLSMKMNSNCCLDVSERVGCTREIFHPVYPFRASSPSPRIATFHLLFEDPSTFVSSDFSHALFSPRVSPLPPVPILSSNPPGGSSSDRMRRG